MCVCVCLCVCLCEETRQAVFRSVCEGGSGLARVFDMTLQRVVMQGEADLNLIVFSSTGLLAGHVG